MNREIISTKQGIAVVVLFMLGSALIIGSGAPAGKDAWLAIIIAIIISFLLFMIYARILSIFPRKDLFDILEYIFGKFLGKGISIIYIFFAFEIGVNVAIYYGEFINIVSLYETPKIVNVICIIILCIWGVKSGIEVLGRWGKLAFPIIIFLIVLTILLLIPDMDIKNIQPLLSKDVKQISEGVLAVIAIPFGETVIFCFISSAFKENRDSYKIFLWGLIIAGAIIFGTALAELLVLGEREYTILYFPSHCATSRMKIGNFMQRSEVVVSTVFVTSGFIKVSICLLGTCKGIAKIFRLNNYRPIVVPVALLMTNVAYLSLEGMPDMRVMAYEIWPYFAILFQVILPVVILIAGEIKVKLLIVNSK